MNEIPGLFVFVGIVAIFLFPWGFYLAYRVRKEEKMKQEEVGLHDTPIIVAKSLVHQVMDDMEKDAHKIEQIETELEKMEKEIRVAQDYCGMTYCDKHKNWYIPGKLFGCGKEHL